MSYRPLSIVLFFCLILSGCAAPGDYKTANLQNDVSLFEWLELTAIPHLVKELRDSPRFKGEPLLIVSMDGENLETSIDELSAEIRNRLQDGLLKDPGINLVWKQAPTELEPYPGFKELQCMEYNRERYYIGIDVATSSLTGNLDVKIRALDINAKQWVSGFGVSWQGYASATQIEALRVKRPDASLKGLRVYPFKEQEADLLAKYLGMRMSCLFADLELEESLVYVNTTSETENSYLAKTARSVESYLAKFKKVTTTKSPASANITIDLKLEKVHDMLYQVWVGAGYTDIDKNIPGRETEAYVILSSPMPPTQTEHGATQASPPSISTDSASKSLKICFTNYRESFGRKIYPMLTGYPELLNIEGDYDSCNSSISCSCYKLETRAPGFPEMPELLQWLDTNLDILEARHFQMTPTGRNSLTVHFNSGFD